MMKSQKEKVKSQNHKSKLKTFEFWLVLLPFAFLLLTFGLCDSVYAKEITILYIGETHAMLYPCNCPKEPDGGISRRATLLKQLKEKYPDALVLDSGGFFAGGLMDEYTQNTQLDMQRSRVNLSAMELMQYDAAAIGDDEFNFGREFFQENALKTNITFLSCNLKADKVLPYIIKEVGNTKIGILGVTTPLASGKAGGLEFTEPRLAVKSTVEELRKRGVNLIVLLSHLGENEDLNLINEVAGIDILITGHALAKQEPSDKIGQTLLLRPSWQGRKLSKITFTLKDNQVSDTKIEELRLSDKIPDDPAILAVLPRCFSDNNCKKQGMVGICQNAGTFGSQCFFSEVNKVNLLIIAPKTGCRTCDTTAVVNFLRGQFPGLEVSYLYYPDKKADRLIRDFSLSGLPAYLLGKGVEKEKNFTVLKASLDLKGDFYLLKPQASGIAYFLNRPKINGKIDLFISLADKNSAEILETIKEFNPVIHFLAIGQQDRFDAPGGILEVEEYLRSVCVQKYYPREFWSYMSCRTKNFASSWWEDCAVNLDANKIRSCARSEEGRGLLRENISLNKELEIMFGSTYLLDNQEIFSSKGAPTKEELRKIIKR